MSKTKKEVGNKPKSQGYLVWLRLKRHKGAMIGLAVLIFILLVAIFADFLYDYDVVIKQDIKNRLQSPSWEHPFGTDEMGRDILARVVHGSRPSVFIGVASAIFSTVIGASLGAIAGFYGGKLGEVLMRLADMLAAIPTTLIAIVIAASLGTSVPNLILACSVGGIPSMMRLMRSSVLQCRNSDYVEAIRARGATENYILVKHIVPNSITPIFVNFTLRVSGVIILLAGLSFLGLGIQPPAPEWGALLSNARTYIRDYSYLCVFPGLSIMLCILSLNLLGDGLRDALDPKLK